jgi:hypothetical protein
MFLSGAKTSKKTNVGKYSCGGYLGKEDEKCRMARKNK